MLVAQRILCDLPSELLGERVLVRPYRAGDGAAVFEAIDDSRAHLRPWMPWEGSHQHVEDSEVFVRQSVVRWLSREELVVGIWERSTGEFLGGSGLHPRNWDVPEFEIGYWIRRTAEGKGYVSETVCLLVQLAFETLGASRVCVRCDARNERSAAVVQRLGFVHEGTLRNDARDPAGHLRDTMYFSLLPSEYERLRDQWPGAKA